MPPIVTLRPVITSDLDHFFEHQRDPQANYMAAFTADDPEDRNAFDSHWQRILANPGITNRTILADQQVAGSVASYPDSGHLEVTYWLGQQFWGQGIASAALALFLEEINTRPIYARAAQDNAASLRVLAKCGFVIIGEDRGYANARSTEIDEYLLRRDS
jgi:RimJ/RimL family protein N-acetyltransferase